MIIVMNKISYRFWNINDNKLLNLENNLFKNQSIEFLINMVYYFYMMGFEFLFKEKLYSN